MGGGRVGKVVCCRYVSASVRPGGWHRCGDSAQQLPNFKPSRKPGSRAHSVAEGQQYSTPNHTHASSTSKPASLHHTRDLHSPLDTDQSETGATRCGLLKLCLCFDDLTVKDRQRAAAWRRSSMLLCAPITTAHSSASICTGSCMRCAGALGTTICDHTPDKQEQQ